MSKEFIQRKVQILGKWYITAPEQRYNNTCACCVFEDDEQCNFTEDLEEDDHCSKGNHIFKLYTDPIRGKKKFLIL